MKISQYFEEREGVGVLATADADGNVDAALYGRPHFFDDETIAFIAAEKLTHDNLQSNPHAVYLFKEKDRYEGWRLYITKIREEKDGPLIEEIRRKKYPEVEGKYKVGPKYLIYFRLDKVLPLIGEGR
ncbi:MAG: pyridoxamine 5'-phosphate oxidase family protein [Syntrophales bacterium]